MTKVIIVAPRQEIVIHTLDIFDKSSVKKINEFVRIKSLEYGSIQRILMQNGETRIMDPSEDLPVPFLKSKD